MTHTTRIAHAVRLLTAVQKRQRKGFTLIELLVVVVIIGILASVALPSFVGAQDKARNASVAANVNTIRMALEQWATDNNGSYPASTTWLNANAAGLRTGGYLPGNRLPKAPWSANAQTVAKIPAATVQEGIANIAGGTATLTPIGTVIDNSGVVATAPSENLHFGFIAYDYAPDNQIYVVYGTGKKNRAAITAAGTSNGSN
ncbi:MAG: prepilin-type N-terminal cleavage/methylation domain-containing protein [Candidatus Sericytochromatia bacterium]|nr:prepilin-type N-terminal cleavage/methylation domain-containing protein [Candidatus Sericytochromatia bacterium]